MFKLYFKTLQQLKMIFSFNSYRTRIYKMFGINQNYFLLFDII